MKDATELPPFQPSINHWPRMAGKDYTLALQGDDIDARDMYPMELARELAVQGFSSITLPTEYGGGSEFSYEAN